MKHFFFYIHILITIFAYHSLLLSKKFSFLSASSFLLPPSPDHFLFLSSTSSFSTYLSSFSNLFRDPLLHFLTLTSLKFTHSIVFYVFFISLCQIFSPSISLFSHLPTPFKNSLFICVSFFLHLFLLLILFILFLLLLTNFLLNFFLSRSSYLLRLFHSLLT